MKPPACWEVAESATLAGPRGRPPQPRIGSCAARRSRQALGPAAHHRSFRPNRPGVVSCVAPPRRRFQHGKVQAVHLHHPAAAGLARRSAAPCRTGSNHCPRWCRQAAPPPPPPPPPQVGATTRWVPPPHPAFHRLRLRLLFLLCRRGGPASVGWHGRDRAFLLDGRVGPQRASDGRGGTGLSSLMTASTSIDCFGVMPILARPQSSALSNSVYLSSALSAAALAEELGGRRVTGRGT